MENNVSERDESIEKIKKETMKALNDEYVEEALQHKEKEFEIDGTFYKVSKPKYSMKKDTYSKRIAEHNKLLSEKDDKGNFIFKSEAELIKVYKERGIDIESKKIEMGNVLKKRDEMLLKLGKLLGDKAQEADLEIYKKEVEKLNSKYFDLSAEVTKLLEDTIENQTITYAYSYLAYLVTEKKVKKDSEWVKAFDSYENFVDSTPAVVNKIIFEASFILYGELSL